MSVRGVIAGAMGLAVLDALLTHSGSAQGVAGAFSGVTNVVSDFISPTVPTFKASASTTSATTGSSGVVLA